MKELFYIKSINEYKSEKEIFEKDIISQIIEEFERDFKYTITNKDNIEHLEFFVKKRLEQYRRMHKRGQVGFFQHNCSECLYLGDYIKASFDEKSGTLNIAYFDLYAYPRITENIVEFIARYGDELDEYYSFSYFVEGEWKMQKTIMESNDGIYEAFERYGKRCRPKMPEWYMKLFPDETCS